MSWCGDRNRESTLYGNTTLKRQQLQSDLTLIVVHGYNAIVVGSLQENCIARERTLNIYAFFPSGQNCGTDVINLLPAKAAIFTIVRV